MERKTYYDAEPWYQREKTADWYQQMKKANQAIRDCILKRINEEAFVTEVACGGGWLAEYIATLKPKAYRGFDFAETAARNAAQRLGNLENFHCFHGDALSLEAYDPKTNFILAHQFLHCLIGDDRKRWLGICKQILAKTSGRLLLSSMIGLPDSLKGNVDETTRINRPGNRYYAEDDEIRRELVTSGFRIEDIQHPEPYVAIYSAIA